MGGLDGCQVRDVTVIPRHVVDKLLKPVSGGELMLFRWDTFPREVHPSVGHILQFQRFVTVPDFDLEDALGKFLGSFLGVDFPEGISVSGLSLASRPFEGGVARLFYGCGPDTVYLDSKVHPAEGPVDEEAAIPPLG